MTEEIRSTLTHGRIQVNFTMTDVFGHVIIWTAISVITAGIGLFFWPYAAAKFVINGLTIYDNADRRVGKLQCNISAGQQVGHVVLWIILTLVTAGIAFPFYLFSVIRAAFSVTEII